MSYAGSVYDPRITLPGGTSPPPAPPPKVARPLTLAYEGRKIPLVRGDLLIGRAPTCHLTIDEMMVSRVHAKIQVTDDVVVVRDLNSTNGVFVNGSRIDRPTPLRAGDMVAIGSAELAVVAVETADAEQSHERLVAQREEPVMDPTAPPAAPSPEKPDLSERTRKADVFEQLGAIADRLLAAGRVDLAERSLSGHLRSVLDGARDGRELPEATMAVACAYALKLADAKGDGKWFDYAIEVHLLLKRPLNASLTDKVSILVRRRLGIDKALFAKYRAMLKTTERTMSVSDRILCVKILAIDPDR